MLELDYWAQRNRWRNVSLLEKALLFLGGLIFALVLKNPWELVALILVMHGVILFAAKIPVQLLLKMWMAPLAFLGISLLTIALSIGREAELFISAFSIGNWYIGFTEAGIVTSQSLILRVIASISCLFGLATTTPASYGAAWLSQNSFLRPIAEIGLLTYRFIFVVLTNSGRIYQAQTTRLGYFGYKRSIRSLSLLAGNLGRGTFWSVRYIYLALVSRGYEQQLCYRYPQYPVNYMRIGAIIIFWLALVTSEIFYRGIMI